MADSVGNTLASDAGARSAWIQGSTTWADRLLPPLLNRVRKRLAVSAELDPLTRAAMSRRLAAEAATVRWDEATGRELSIRNDPDVVAAMALFGKMTEILKR